MWLIRTPVKRLFLRDTSSSALALGASCPYRNASPFMRLIERAQEIWNFRCRFYTRQIQSRCQNLFMLTRKRAKHWSGAGGVARFFKRISPWEIKRSLWNKFTSLGLVETEFFLHFFFLPYFFPLFGVQRAWGDKRLIALRDLKETLLIIKVFTSRLYFLHNYSIYNEKLPGIYISMYPFPFHLLVLIMY